MIPLRKNKRGTLPKTLKLTAKAPENGWLGDDFCFPFGAKGLFSGAIDAQSRTVVFGKSGPTTNCR